MNETITSTNFGLQNFWSSGDLISHLTILVLLVMSILSWSQIIKKGWKAFKGNLLSKNLEDAWLEKNDDAVVSKVSSVIGDHHEFTNFLKKTLSEVKEFDLKHGFDNSNRQEFITRILRKGLRKAAAKLESGMTILASVGSVAPFVGLFGTVYGIYHALLGIASSGSASLDKISGPVGEALIMTAFGLFVAIPAVMAYNTFVKLNNLEISEFDGLTHDLQSYLNDKIKR